MDTIDEGPCVTGKSGDNLAGDEKSDESVPQPPILSTTKTSSQELRESRPPPTQQPTQDYSDKDHLEIAAVQPPAKPPAVKNPPASIGNPKPNKTLIRKQKERLPFQSPFGQTQWSEWRSLCVEVNERKWANFKRKAQKTSTFTMLASYMRYEWFKDWLANKNNAHPLYEEEQNFLDSLEIHCVPSKQDLEKSASSYVSEKAARTFGQNRKKPPGQSIQIVVAKLPSNAQTTSGTESNEKPSKSGFKSNRCPTSKKPKATSGNSNSGNRIDSSTKQTSQFNNIKVSIWPISESAVELNEIKPHDLLEFGSINAINEWFSQASELKDKFCELQKSGAIIFVSENEKHIYIYPTNKKESNTEWEKYFACFLCPDFPKLFTTVNNLNEHMKLHTEPCIFSCQNAKCKKKFTTQRNANRHFEKKSCSKTHAKESTVRTILGVNESRVFAFILNSLKILMQRLVSQASKGLTIEATFKEGFSRSSKFACPPKKRLTHPGSSTSASVAFLSKKVKPPPNNGTSNRREQFVEEDEEDEQEFPEAKALIKEHPALSLFEPWVIQTVLDCQMTADNVGWDDVAGMADVKKIIEEKIMWPLLAPRIIPYPPKSILFYGPPGTGKTLVAQVVANMTGRKLFNVSPSDIMSKYIGDSEKIVRALFTVAEIQSPSIIFIDEVESLLRKRSGDDSYTRNMKMEFVKRFPTSERVSRFDEAPHAFPILVIGATNFPQDIDFAFRRRFTIKIHIPLPPPEGRLDHLKKLVATMKSDLSDEDYKTLVRWTAGYSGADLDEVMKEANYGPIRDANAEGRNIGNLTPDDLRPLVLDDFAVALETVGPTVGSEELDAYEKFDSAFRGGKNRLVPSKDQLQ